MKLYPDLPDSFEHLTARQQKFALAYVKSLNASEAFRDAGFSPVAANVNASRLMAKDNIQRALADLLPVNGITDQLILRRIFEGLHAQKRSVKYDEKRGEWAYSKRDVDHATRLNAADMAARLKGAYPKERHEGGNYTLIVQEGNMQVNQGESSSGTRTDVGPFQIEE
jgi:phage terminase small subunit